MDVCLGLGVGETMMTLMRNRTKSPGTFQDPSADLEKTQCSSLSWAFVSRNPPVDTDEASRNDRLGDTGSVSSVSDSSRDDSRSISSNCCSTSSSTSSYSKMSLWGSRKREGRKPAVLDRTPFGRSTEYLTVHVGTRWELSVKYVIRRKLLTHPLFRVLLKCSEDEFGEDYAVKKGVSIACEPALFLEVVKAVDQDLWSVQNDFHAWAGMTTTGRDTER